MTAAMKHRFERQSFDLIRMSATKLVDDTREYRTFSRLVVPIRATATIAEMIAAKAGKA